VVPALAPAATPGAGPAVQFAELVHDFGKIAAGAVVKHEFVFTNTGNATLMITDVRPGCGCTTAGTWDRQVEPGQIGRIPLQLNSTGFSGMVAKSATVTCNAAGQSNLFLQLKANIWRPIDVTPASAYFNVSAEAATNETRVVRIINNQETPLTLSSPVCTNQAFRTELRTIREGKEFELHVTVQPPFPANYAQGPVTLKTSSTNIPVLSIPLYAHIQPVILTIPSMLSLPPGPSTAAAQPSFTIRNTGTNVLTLSEPQINLEGATVSLREVQTGRVFMATLNVPAGLQFQATQRVEVTVKSSHPNYPIVRVPVIQQQRAAGVTAARTPPATTPRVTPSSPPSVSLPIARPAFPRLPPPLPPPVPTRTSPARPPG